MTAKKKVNIKKENGYKFLKKLKEGKIYLTLDIRKAWAGSKREANKFIKENPSFEVFETN